MTRFRLISFLFLILMSTLGWAAAGDFAVGGAVGAANPIAPSQVREHGSVGPALGAHLGYDVSENWNAEVSYDNLYVGNAVRIEPLILSTVWHHKLGSGLEPFLQAGVGVGRGAGGGSFNNFAAKAGIGLIFKYHEAISYGPQVIYHYVGDQGDAFRSVHTLTPGVFASYHFSL